MDLRQVMSDAKFYGDYSRWIEQEDKYESWNEAVERVMGMHREKFKEELSTISELEELFQQVEEAYKDKLILGSQRALQFGGKQLLKNNAKLYNCFDVSTKFLTSEGFRKFSDFNPGDDVQVLTHKGNWKKAKVKSYGTQDLYKVVLAAPREKNKLEFLVTKNHRWILSNGKETTNLNVGDKLLRAPTIFHDFDKDDCSPEELLYWAYGYVYGDGTTTKNGYSLVRLCGEDAKFEPYFKSLGFNTTQPQSIKGDVYVFTGKYQKDLPDPKIDSPALIRAFVAGYFDADGEKERNQKSPTKFSSIQSSREEDWESIRDLIAISGIRIRSEMDLTGQITNFAPDGRKPTRRFLTKELHDGKTSSYYTVESIEYEKSDEVWCLEVEDDRSFILENFVPTGNCTASYCDRVDFFGEFMWWLLSGAGCGVSVQKKHIAELPNMVKPSGPLKTFVIPDSIEGWADAAQVLIASYFEPSRQNKFSDWSGKRIHFDSSKIREKGAYISGGFKAPGPDPLVKALGLVQKILQSIVEDNRDRMKPIEAYDICMHLADAVISGGVRRSATIFLFSLDDEEMMTAKTGDWYIKNPQRARSNISALIIRNQIKKKKFKEIFENIKQFGEPGFIFADDEDYLTNPCAEIGLYAKLHMSGSTTISGWQCCNLTEGNGSAIQTEEDFYRMCEASAILGTLQAAYTHFPYLPSVTKEIVEKEALLGCSITGTMSNPEILLNEEILSKGAAIVRDTNKRVARLIGINQAARTTTQKPSGNSAVILMTSSGIHADKGRKMLRYNVYMNDSDVAQVIKEHNPQMVEIGQGQANSYAVAFPIEAPEGAYIASDMTGVEFLENVRKAYRAWVMQGKNPELCVQPWLNHNISNTVEVQEGEWDHVCDFVFEYRDEYTGISFMSAIGDRAFYQAPFTVVKEEEDIVREHGAGSMFASGLIVDAIAHGFRNLWEACYIAENTVNPDDMHGDLEELQARWVRRFHKFAGQFFNGDMAKTSLCLKDVQILYRWEKIINNYKEIDFEQSLGPKEFVDVSTLAAQACSGGGCEITF